MSRDALIVGVNTYQHLPSLQAPARDAEAIAHQLQTYGEFCVHRLPEVIQANTPQVGMTTQVSLRELEAALIRLFKPKGNHIPQTALFYFSGHGLQKEAGIQEGFLAVSDTNPDASFYGLSLFWLRRLLQESPVRQRIIWLDCCHSGELLNFLEADPGAHPSTDRLFMAASRDYETAYESLTSPYSVFTQALLTGLDPRRVESGIVTQHALIDHVNQTLKTEIQRPLFESSGSEIVLTRCHDRAFRPAIKSSSIACPYPGFRAFSEAQADYFYGRDQLLQRVTTAVKHNPFVALVGASGSGKTSLVHAGLFPQLRQEKRQEQTQNQLLGDRWQIKCLTPTHHPLQQLAAAFVEPHLSQVERAEQLRRAEIFLEQGNQGLAHLVRATLPVELALETQNRSRLLLVIDQFEELFTQCRSKQAIQERQQFIDCLTHAVGEAGDYFNLLIVVRSDAIGHCSLYAELATLLQHHAIAMSSMTYEEVKATIVSPATRAGIACEPSLVYTLLLDTFGASGELPFLQATLSNLWRRQMLDSANGINQLTLDAYLEIGGIRSTLQTHATQVFYTLSPAEQVIAKRIFLALVQLGEGTEDTRRRALKSELISAQFPIEQVDPVLEKLVAARLVVTHQVVVSTPLLKQDAGESRGWLTSPVAYQVREKWLRVVSSRRSPASGTTALLKSGGDSVRSFIPSSITSHNDRTNPSIAATACQVDRTSHSISCCHKTIEIAHEALIRHWSLMRGWLEEARDRLSQQRRLEHAAQEWNSKGQPQDGNYLLQGERLVEVERFLTAYADELSTLAHWYIAISRQAQRRARRAVRVRQAAIPSAIAATLLLMLPPDRPSAGGLRSYISQMVASPKPSSVAPSSTTPTPNPRPPFSTAAIASQQPATVQTVFQAALERLNLRVKLWEEGGTIQQIAFSIDRRYIATASGDGIIRLWSTRSPADSSSLKPMHILLWEPPAASQPSMSIANLLISPNGELLAAVAQNSRQVKVWNVKSGTEAYQLDLAQPITQAVFSRDGNWIAVASADQTVSLWRAQTGKLQTRFTLQDDQSDFY